MLCPVLGALLALASPAPSPESGPATTPTTLPAAVAYDAAQADADIEIVLTQVGKAYLEARARLEAAPEVSAVRLAVRLQASPAVSPVEARRILAILAEMARPEDLARFAEQLRRDVTATRTRGPGGRDEVRAAEPWLAIFRSQGAAAVPTLRTLVGDREFSLPLRAILVADMVALTPPSEVASLVDLVGAGVPELRLALKQALVRRAREPGLRPVLLAATDAALATDPARTPALLGLRAALSTGDDPGLTTIAAGLAEADEQPFAVRIAALRILVARASQPPAQAALQRLANHHLDATHRDDQRSEIIGALALSGLTLTHARTLVERQSLLAAAAPRIAQAAYAAAALASDGTWLDASQAHPWPEVRSAALARVDGPCAAPLVKRLTAITDPDRGEDEVTVAREAIAALGRCGGEAAWAALTRILGTRQQSDDRRAEAARQLLNHHGDRGAQAVAETLDRSSSPRLSVKLIRALGHHREISLGAAVRDALCRASESSETAAAARQALQALGSSTHDCKERRSPDRPDPEKPRVYGP